MVRMNITIPDDVSRELRHVKNKSRFIAETLREKFITEYKNMIDKKLEESYKKSVQEDLMLVKDWDIASGDPEKRFSLKSLLKGVNKSNTHKLVKL